MTGDVFLGMGLACARCHDHKFDPLLRQDYFQLRAFFEPIVWRDDVPMATPDEMADYQQGPPTFGPRLAESYEFSADHKELTFHLRDDIVWSDGVPVTAEDVRWTWQAQTSPEVAWAFVDAKARITDVEVVE